jgi:hypothetical protein
MALPHPIRDEVNGDPNDSDRFISPAQPGAMTAGLRSLARWLESDHDSSDPAIAEPEDRSGNQRIGPIGAIPSGIARK